MPYSLGSGPIMETHPSTMRAYCRVVRCRPRRTRQKKRKSPADSPASLIHACTASRVSGVNSRSTGLPVFCWSTLARERIWSPWATSLMRRGTRSQPRSLLSMARLNSARSRSRPAICSRMRISQICRRVNGRFCPVSLPLFQGAWVCGEARFLPLLNH